MGRRRKEQASLDMVEAVEAEIVDAAADELEIEVEAAIEEEQEVAPVYEEEAPAPIANPTKWVVLADQVVSLFGQVTLLPAGTVVSAASYGPVGIKRIMEQGVQLEPVA